MVPFVRVQEGSVGVKYRGCAGIKNKLVRANSNILTVPTWYETFEVDAQLALVGGLSACHVTDNEVKSAVQSACNMPQDNQVVLDK